MKGHEKFNRVIEAKGLKMSDLTGCGLSDVWVYFLRRDVGRKPSFQTCEKLGPVLGEDPKTVYDWWHHPVVD